MRFEIILHMPVRGGDLVHRLIVEHTATSLEKFVHVLHNCDFVVVEEFFPSKYNKEVLESHGLIALNHRYIGKVKEWEER